MTRISENEEITANYCDLEDGLNREHRLPFLQNNFRWGDKVCVAL